MTFTSFINGPIFAALVTAMVPVVGGFVMSHCKLHGRMKTVENMLVKLVTIVEAVQKDTSASGYTAPGSGDQMNGKPNG